MVGTLGFIYEYCKSMPGIFEHLLSGHSVNRQKNLSIPKAVIWCLETLIRMKRANGDVISNFRSISVKHRAKTFGHEACKEVGTGRV